MSAFKHIVTKQLFVMERTQNKITIGYLPVLLICWASVVRTSSFEATSVHHQPWRNCPDIQVFPVKHYPGQRHIKFLDMNRHSDRCMTQSLAWCHQEEEWRLQECCHIHTAAMLTSHLRQQHHYKIMSTFWWLFRKNKQRNWYCRFISICWLRTVSGLRNKIHAGKIFLVSKFNLQHRNMYVWTLERYRLDHLIAILEQSYISIETLRSLWHWFFSLPSFNETIASY